MPAAALVLLASRASPCSYVPIEMCSAPWYAASSPARSASTAGAIETSADSSSCATGPQPRLAETADDDRRAEHRRRACAGSPSAASRRRQLAPSPAAAARAPRRAGPGPRRSGLLTRDARKRLRADATSIRPVVVRGSRTPTRSARARARRSGAPCRRAGSSPSAPSRRRVVALSRAPIVRAWRSQRTPSSRSATGMRSSAEWTSVAATSGGSSPVEGKKPYATVPNASRSQWLSVKPAHTSGAAFAPGSTSATNSSSALPERRVERRPRAAPRLDPLELVLDVAAEHRADHRLDVLRVLPGQEPAVDLDLADARG